MRVWNSNYFLYLKKQLLGSYFEERWCPKTGLFTLSPLPCKECVRVLLKYIFDKIFSLRTSKANANKMIDNIFTAALTWEASWEKTASKANIFGAGSTARLCTEVGCVLSEGSYRVSCFLRVSTFRKDSDSDESTIPSDGQIRIITLTWNK